MDNDGVGWVIGFLFVVVIVISVLWYRDHQSLKEKGGFQEDTVISFAENFRRCNLELSDTKDNLAEANQEIDSARNQAYTSYYNMGATLSGLETFGN